MSAVEEIAAEFLDERGWSRKTPLPRETVRRWIASDDLETLGAARQLLQRKGHFARVEPPLEPSEKREFLTRYFERAIDESKLLEESDETSEWIDSGFDLSHGLAYWVAEFLRDEATPPRDRELVIAWVRTLLLHHPRASLIETAVSDHLVWNRATKRFFKAWQGDEELAYLFGR